MSFFENTRKPVGFGGKIMVAMMNFGHSAMAEWGLSFLQPAPDAMVLDCGCGGGANIKTLLKLCPNGKVKGIDYSAVSVEKARKVNARAIAAGRCTVQQASVAELPFEAEQFDVVTAFETVYFWPELAQNFREVYRVLKPGGVFFICNEANGETTKDDKWTQIIDGMTIYTDTALKEYLEQAGFCQIQSHKNINQQSDWFSLCDFLHLSAFLRQIEFLPNSLMVLPYMKLTLYFFWQMKPIAKSEFLFFSLSEMSK